MRRLTVLPLLLGSGCALFSPAPAPAPDTSPRQTAIVELVDTNHIALFWGEREMLRRAIADHLRRQSSLRLQPVPDLELEVLRAQLQKDREQCAAPTRASAWWAGQHPEAVYVRASASCITRPCTLQVRVQRPPEAGTGPWTVLERWAAPVQDPTDANQWINAVGSLTLEVAATGAGGDLLGSVETQDRPKVQILGVSTVHPWASAPSPASLATAQDALDACHVPGWTSAGTDHVAVEVSPEGRIARCEGDSHRDDEGPERLKCVCKALARSTFDRGPRGRRFEVQLMNRPVGGPAKRAGVQVRLESAPAPRGFEPEPALNLAGRQLEACLPTAALDTPMQVDLQVGPTGTVTVQSISGVEASVRACAEGVLGAVKLPCPPNRGPIALQATYHLVVRAP